MLESILSAIPPPVAFAILLVLLCLPYVLITSAIERAKGLPVPKDVQEAGTTKEWRKLNKHHELTIKGSRKALATDVRARLLAPAMPYALCQGNPVNTFTLTDPTSMKQMLQRDWWLSDRNGLLTQLYSLLKGGHREDFENLRRQCAHPTWVSSTLARLDKKADEDTYAWEKRWRIHRLLNNDRRVQSVDFAAWDFIRAAMLTRIGAGLGWIGEEEACDTLAVINHALQLSYSSWDEAWDAFRTTRWFWAAEGQAQEATNDLHDRHRGEILIGKNGLWTSIPWNAPYPAPRFLILDALAPTKQLSTLSRQKRERSSRWEQELDDQTTLRIVPRR
ncbi:DUF1266 domain-containing protein [Pauljensenia sp. 20925_1_34]|uniref:DUF1266 domain-containing protein n=1 Tax=Pauljensenia sp. 20925_1_34 TaxID=3003674 RepID=UPI00352FB422